MFNSEGDEDKNKKASEPKHRGDDQQTESGQLGTGLDQPNPPRKVVNKLQHKPGAHAPSTQIRRSKRLKTMAIARQDGVILKSSRMRSEERMVTTP